MRIANHKLARLDPPAWRSYRGLSVLYDNPGCAALGGVQPLESLPTAQPDGPDAYTRLWELAVRIRSAMRDGGAELGLLPPPTYHVTLCDGVSDGERAHVRAEVRADVEATLDGLPDSLLWANDVVRLLRADDLRWRVWCHPVTFRPDSLCVWGHAFVARLRPDDEPATSAQAHHDAARDELAARLAARLGVQPQAWRPHVTLGYLANDDAADHLRERVLPSWHDAVAARVAPASLAFRSASLYGFTDMAHFWRLGH